MKGGIIRERNSKNLSTRNCGKSPDHAGMMALTPWRHIASMKGSALIHKVDFFSQAE